MIKLILRAVKKTVKMYNPYKTTGLTWKKDSMDHNKST